MSEQRMEEGVIVAPTNDAVRAVNNVVLRRMPGSKKTYLSKTRLDLQDRGAAVEAGGEGFTMCQEELDSISPARIPPHRLELKVGAIVMLLFNMCKAQGLCNGTRFMVTGLYKDTIKVRRLTEFRGRREELFLPKVIMRTDDVPVAGTIQRLQIPVCLAMCMTINKVQGRSYDYVGLFLRRPVFSHGQFFVAVSRGRKREGVFVAVIQGAQQGWRNSGRGVRVVKTKNIVIRRMLE